MVDTQTTNAVSYRLGVLEDRINSLDANVNSSRLRTKDATSNLESLYESIFGHLQALAEQVSALTGEPLIAAAVTSVRARRAMRPAAEDREQPALTPGQQAMVPSFFPEAFDSDDGGNHETCTLEDMRIMGTDTCEHACTAAEEYSQVSLAAGSTEVGYPTEAELAYDNLKELLVQHMNATSTQFEILREQRAGASECFGTLASRCGSWACDGH